jgi:hypothetical protein
MPRIACYITPDHPDAGFSSASLRWSTPARGRRPKPFERTRAAFVPVNTTPIRIASGPAEKFDNRSAVRVTKSFSRPVVRSPCRRGPMRARAGPVC